MRVVRELLSLKTLVTSKHVEGSFKRKTRKSRDSQAWKRLSRSEGGLAMFRDDSLDEATPETLAEESYVGSVNSQEYIHPVAADVDAIDLDGNTSLHIAVKSGGKGDMAFYEIAELLLKFGANANKPILSPSGNISPLMCACLHENTRMVDILLKHGAKDADNKVLSQAISVQNDDVIGVFLKSKNHVDSATRVNAPKLHELFHMSRANVMSQSWCNSTINLRHVWPSVSVLLDWRGLGLLSLNVSWLIEACKQHNRRLPKAKLSMSIDDLALFAITRIDVSDNELTKLPLEMFKLPSLRSLTAANNHIDWIPGCAINVPRSCSCLASILRPNRKSDKPRDVTPCSSKCVHVTANRESQQVLNELWDCPLLEELNLQGNALSTIPTALCRLPMLRKVNLSLNKISSIPSDIWQSASLIELNLSHNELQTLFVDDVTSVPDKYGGCDVMSPPHYATDSSSLWQQGRRPSHSSASMHDTSQQSFEQTTEVSLRLPGYKNGFRPMSVSYVEQWHDTLRVHDHSDSVKRKAAGNCKLTDLNVSHNSISSLPDNLVCLAPFLETLNLSHNKMNLLGMPNLYPSGLRELDLSYNEINRMFSEDLDNSVDSGIFTQPTACQSPYAKSKSQQRYHIRVTISGCDLDTRIT